MNRKGQLTIFIILGIVLLVSIVLVLVLRSETSLFRPERVLPSNVENLQRFMTSCIQENLDNGLMILGTQGGYVYLPPSINENPDSYVDIGLKIPFWIYQAENRIPTIPIMEAHLQRYIEQNMDKCSLDQFREEVDIREKSPPQVEVNIGESGVTAQVDFPLEISQKTGEKIIEISTFTAKSPVRLKQMTRFAFDFAGYQTSNRKIEELAVDLIALNDDTPLSGMKFSCSPDLWSVSDVHKKIVNMLSYNLASVRMSNGAYLDLPEDQPYLQNHFVWDVSDETYDKISTTLRLGPSPVLMNVRPSEGDMMQASVIEGSELLSFLCMQHYKFTYDLRFPVIVEVEDLKNNYNLQFALYGEVRQNQPLMEPLAQPEFTFIAEHASSDDYCNGFTPQRIKIKTYDNVTDPVYGNSTEAVHGINLTYMCLRYSCPLGVSRFSGGSAELTADVPYCTSPMIRASAPGYIERTIFLSGDELSVYLTPIKEITDYEVLKHTISGDDIGPARPLEDDERAYITLNADSYSTSGGYPRDFNITKLELLASVNMPYDVKVFVMKENRLVGGYEAQWTPKWSDVNDAEKIVFHTITPSNALTDSNFLSFIQTLPNASKRVPAPEVLP